MKNDYKFTSEDQMRDMWSKRQKTLVFFSVCVPLSLSCTCVVESRVFVKPIVSHSVHSQTAIVWIQRKWQISSCKKPTGVCSNAKTSVVRRASSISREMWLLSTQQAFSKPQCLFTSSSLCFLTNSPQYFSTSAPPQTFTCIIHAHVRGLSPILCLINKTYLCACSLHPSILLSRSQSEILESPLRW